MVDLDKKFSRHGTQSSNSVRGYSDPIPVDLLIDIFSRVPAKSIARFRCISKFWASILQRPDFIELFLAKSLTRPRLLFYYKPDAELIFYSLPQPQNLDESSSVIATRYHTFSFPNFYVACTCTGLVVLLQRYGRNSVICNPVTGESVTLPYMQMNIQKFYVGYDPINKQFKVLCMSWSNTHLVLTLETGTLLWRIIDYKFDYGYYAYIRNEVCMNGVLYFASWHQESPKIVCFEVRSEKFGFIELDEDILEDCFSVLLCRYTLVNYKGKLGVYKLQDRYEQPSQLVLWVLEDAGKNKWSKHVYQLTPEETKIVDRSDNVGMTDAGEIVFASCKYSETYFYNLESNTLTRVNFHGLEEFEDHNFLPGTFLNYVENMKLL